MDNRKVFFGWDNLTYFEKKQLKEVKDFITKTLNKTIPENYHERDILKFCQSHQFNIAKSSAAIVKNISWL